VQKKILTKTSSKEEERHGGVWTEKSTEDNSTLFTIFFLSGLAEQRQPRFLLQIEVSSNAIFDLNYSQHHLEHNEFEVTIYYYLSLKTRRTKATTFLATG